MAMVGPAALNVSEAARLAGYRPGTSRPWAILQKPAVQRAIAHALAKKFQEPVWVLDALGAIAASDMSQFVDVDEQGRATVNWAKAVRGGAMGSVQSLELDDNGNIKKFKLYDKLKAHELILRYHGKLDGGGWAHKPVDQLIQLYMETGRDPASWPVAIREVAEARGLLPPAPSPGTATVIDKPMAEGEVRRANSSRVSPDSK
jgi:hypothetical protein